MYVPAVDSVPVGDVAGLCTLYFCSPFDSALGEEESLNAERRRGIMLSGNEPSCRAETRHAALVDILDEINGHGKIISIISTKNHDMQLRYRLLV